MTTWTDCLSDSLDGLPDKDRQSAKTRDTRESGRYAPPSCSPEDGNHYGDVANREGAKDFDRRESVTSDPTTVSNNYDQEASTSTDDPQPEGLTGPTAGGSCDTFTADGDIREDSQAKPDGSAITRNETMALDALETSANIYATRQAKNGDSATREARTKVPQSPSCNTPRRPATFGDNGHPWHAMQDLEKVIPAKRLAKLKENLKG